jgi:1-phosphatidylinositol phosphodiesterase
MLLTIRNLTDEPIAGHTYPSPSKFSASLQAGAKAPPSASEFLLQPLLNFSTILPKGTRRELILRRSQNGPEPLRANFPNTVEKARLLDNEWHIHPEGFKIRFSMTFSASWQVVKVPLGCPWRVYTSRVCNLFNLNHCNTYSMTVIIDFKRPSQTRYSESPQSCFILVRTT